MSSVYPGGNPGRRKPKVSEATFVVFGLVDPKARPKRRSRWKKASKFAYLPRLVNTQRVDETRSPRGEMRHPPISKIVGFRQIRIHEVELLWKFRWQHLEIGQLFVF